MKQNEQTTLRGRSTLTAYYAGTDKIAHRQTVGNLVVSTGLALTAKLLAGTSIVGLTYHAIGTGATAPALTDTTLTTETARKTWTSIIQTGRVVTFSVFYLASEATADLKEAGVFGGATASGTANSGEMFSHYLQAYDNTAGLFDLTYEYEVEVS
jgi:hypothetical protein